ncbi:MAG: YtxH domain-containing protein, partial [Saprospiraceae bacterium]
RLFGLPFLPLTWAGFFVPLVVENQRYDTSPLFSLRPIHATKPIQKQKIMNSGKVVLGILAGFAIGATLGVLFAPDKGTSTRKKISKKSDDVVNELSSKFNSMVDGVTKKFETLKSEATHLMESGKAKAEEMAENGRAKAEDMEARVKAATK